MGKRSFHNRQRRLQHDSECRYSLCLLYRCTCKQCIEFILLIRYASRVASYSTQIIDWNRTWDWKSKRVDLSVHNPTIQILIIFTTRKSSKLQYNIHQISHERLTGRKIGKGAFWPWAWQHWHSWSSSFQLVSLILSPYQFVFHAVNDIILCMRVFEFIDSMQTKIRFKILGGRCDISRHPVQQQLSISTPSTNDDHEVQYLSSTFQWSRSSPKAQRINRVLDKHSSVLSFQVSVLWKWRGTTKIIVLHWQTRAPLSYNLL